MRPSNRPDRSASRLVAMMVIGAGALIMLAPFYFMVVFATHSDHAILAVPPPLLPGNAFFHNVRVLLRHVPFFWQNLGWSFYIALITTALNLGFCSLAGAAFALYDFRFKKKLFAAVMGTLLLPAFVTMIPTVLVMSWLHWINQPRALYLPAACSALGIFMMRQSIAATVPRELVDAARMDGCGEFGIYLRIVLPLVTPALGTLGLVTFIASWNHFLIPLVVLRDMESFTVPLALRSMQGTGETPWGAICAGSVITVLPLLVLFVFASRRLIESLTTGAVKP